MAAATTYMIQGRNIVVVNVKGAFNASDETDTVIIDKSALTGPDGTEPGSISIEEITWTIGPGFAYVLLEWEHNTDDVVDYFHGQGYVDFRPYGGKNDPESEGGTGDLVLTTSGGAAGDTYSFIIRAKLKD